MTGKEMTELLIICENQKLIIERKNKHLRNKYKKIKKIQQEKEILTKIFENDISALKLQIEELERQKDVKDNDEFNNLKSLNKMMKGKIEILEKGIKYIVVDRENVSILENKIMMFPPYWAKVNS